MDYDENLSDEEPGYAGDHDDQEIDVEADDQEDDAIRQECVERFSTTDYIMEPGVFVTLQKYFKAGGIPESVVELLSGNYKATAQTVNLLAEWLILAGVDIHVVQEMVESHLKDMILKHFDTKKADAIFADGETPSWLQQMIDFQTWRMLFYKLAEEYPDCLMLNFTIKLISDAGYQGEITSVSTACHQLEVFSRVLKTSISSYLQDNNLFIHNNMPDFVKMVCHGEHTYLYTQILLQILSQENKGGAKMRRLSQELQRHARLRGLDVTEITTSLVGGHKHVRASQAIATMLSKGSVNPADVATLHTAYTSADPPPVEMIRNPELLDLIIALLFKPNSQINAEYRSKYIYCLAYAASVAETYKKGVRKSLNKDELKATVTALEKAQKICCETKSSDLVAEISTLFQCLKVPVVAQGVLTWTESVVTEPKYFVHNTDHAPIHLILLDEVSTCQQLLHERVQVLLVRLFESGHEEVDVLVQLSLKRTILDRMVHLLSRGYVLPVVSYIKNCFEQQKTDISLVRYFVTEILEIISPPYTRELIAVLLPLIQNDDITSSMKNDNSSDVFSEFLRHCQETLNGTD